MEVVENIDPEREAEADEEFAPEGALAFWPTRVLPVRQGVRVRVVPLGRSIMAVAALTLASLLLGCGSGEGPPDEGETPARSNQPGGDDFLARVDGITISVEAFRRELERRSHRNPDRYRTPEARAELLDELVAVQVQVARARAAGLADAPEVSREIDRILIRHLRAREVAEQLQAISVSDADVEAHYLEHQEEYEVEAKVRAAIVRLEVPVGADPIFRDRQRALAHALLEEARTLPESYRGLGPIAASHSDHRASRYKGGDVGWLVLGRSGARWDAAMLRGVFALQEPGQLGPVIEGADGFYLVKLLERQPASTPPLAQLRDYIEHQLREEKQRAQLATWQAELARETHIEINQSRLSSIEAPDERPASKVVARPPALPGS